MRSLLLAVCILFCAASSFGQESGTYLFTQGFNYYDQARKNPFVQDRESVSSRLQYWFSKDFSMRVHTGLLSSFNPFPPLRRESGRGDTFVAGTYVVVGYDKTHPLGFAIDYQIKIPTAVRGQGSDKFDHTLSGVLHRNFLNDRLYTEVDAGALILGIPGRPHATTAIVALIETYGLVSKLGNPKSFRWILYNETDYVPAVAGGPSSVTGLDQLVYVFNNKWSFRFGPNYAITPYDARIGFSLDLRFTGHMKRH